MSLNLTRRDLGLLALSLQAACATAPSQAQPRRRTRGPIISPPPPRGPALERAGDIAGIVLEGGGAQADAGVTIGHAFGRGQLPRGARLAARLAPGGAALPAHVQVLARHPDGSARIALITVVPPRLGRGAAAGVLLSRVEPPGRAL